MNFPGRAAAFLGLCLCLSAPPVLARGKKGDAPVAPATKCRLLSVGDHWVFDMNVRTPQGDASAEQGGPLASLFHMGASDNSRAKLDIKVVSPAARDGARAADPPDPPSSADAIDPQAEAPAPDDGVSSDDGVSAEPPDYTDPLSLLMNLTYERGGRKVSDYAVYRFVQERDTGRLLMQDTTNRDHRGYLVPGSWGVGRQFEAFFPVGFIWSLVPSSSLATVVGAERLKLKAGEFRAWKVSQSARPLRTYHTDAEVSNIWWYDPSVVFPVKAQTDYAGGAQFFLTLTTFETANAAPLPLPEPNRR